MTCLCTVLQTNLAMCRDTQPGLSCWLNYICVSAVSFIPSRGCVEGSPSFQKGHLGCTTTAESLRALIYDSCSEGRPARAHPSLQLPPTRSHNAIKSQFIFLGTRISPQAIQPAACLFVPPVSKPPAWGNAEDVGGLPGMKSLSFQTGERHWK